MPFISDITNEENEEGDSEIFMFELQVCDVVTLQKPLLTRWWYINTCDTQVIWYLNSRKKYLVTTTH